MGKKDVVSAEGKIKSKIKASKLELLGELKKQNKKIEKVIRDLEKEDANLWRALNYVGIISADLMYVWRTIGNKTPKKV